VNTTFVLLILPQRPIAGLADSKKLTERRREALYPLIRAQSLAWAIVEVGAAEIDEINILQATLVGMRRAVDRLNKESEPFSKKRALTPKH